MTDERQNLPSASGAQRYALCPGSFVAELGLPDSKTEDSERGDRIHAWLAAEAVQLSDEELEIAKLCENQVHTLKDQFFHDTVMPIEVHERRLWAEGWSGKLDYYAVDFENGLGLIVDYKTGRGEVAGSPSNLQLRAQAVLLAREYPELKRIRVAIVQPLAAKEPAVTDYEGSDLQMASMEVDGIMHYAREGGDRVPSPEACKWCKANGTDRCPESQNVVREVTVASGGVELMSRETLGAFLVACKQAEKTIENARKMAKAMLESGGTVPGWTLKPGREVETIVDPSLVFARWLDHGGTTETFQGAVSLTKKALEEAAFAMWPGDSKADVRRRIKGMLEGATESKTTAPSLVMEDEK